MEKKEIKFIEILFFLLILSCCFQNLSIITINNSFSFKLSHFISLLFFPILIRKGKISLPNKLILFFVSYIFILSLVMSFKYGLNSLFLNYLFGMYILIIICTLGRKIELFQWQKIIRSVAWIVLIFIYIKLLKNFNVVLLFLRQPWGHPMIDTFFGGGVNLEATWIALLGFSMKNDKKGFLYFLLSLVISALYASRVGIIANVLLFIYIFLYHKICTRLSKKKIFFLFVAAVIVAVIIFNMSIFDYVISRFIDTGNDAGSLGRLSMWKYVIPALKNNPLGYGIGNSIKAIETVSCLSFNEDNVHNLLLQMILDLGLIGVLYYLVLMFLLVKISIKSFFSDPFVAFLASYFFLSIFQFRGGDSLMFVVLGIFLIELNSKKQDGDELSSEKNFVY